MGGVGGKFEVWGGVGERELFVMEGDEYEWGLLEKGCKFVD